MDLLPLVPPCVVLAFFVNVGLSGNAFFDFLWATSAYVDALAMLPQLWMLTKIGGHVEGMTSNFVAAMTARSAMYLAFWFNAYDSFIFEGPRRFSARLVQVVISTHC